jgi:hypothetical protein
MEAIHISCLRFYLSTCAHSLFGWIFFNSFGTFSAKILFQTFSCYDRENPSLNIMELPGLEHVPPLIGSILLPISNGIFINSKVFVNNLIGQGIFHGDQDFFILKLSRV